MGRQKKPVTGQMQAFADELRDLHNSDEFHQLFDILCEYKADGGSTADERGQLIEKYIEKTFFKELEDPSAKTEIQFILESLGKAIRSQKYAFESQQVRDDLVQSAVEKIIANAQYDVTAPKAKKFGFIKKVLENLFLDHHRARSREREATKKFVELNSTGNKKKNAA
jgi:hypothetical protein